MIRLIKCHRTTSFLLLLCSVITFCSCNKKHCWECNAYRFYASAPDADYDPDSTYRMCDYTRDEINRYTGGIKYDSIFVNAQGRTATMMRRTSCDKTKRTVSNDIWLHF